MAVPEQTPYIEHTGNGVATSFSLGFQCESKDHLIVLVDGIEPPIATWSLTGGNVVFTTAPAAGKKITVQRNTKFSRPRNFQNYDNSFRAETVNREFDWIWWKLQELGIADWILGSRIDALKNYVDRKDDELKAYLMEEIRKQGVALDQLDEYYNYLMERLAQIAVDKGWDASFVVDGNKNQKQINSAILGTSYYAELEGFSPNNTAANNLSAWTALQARMIAGDTVTFKNGVFDFSEPFIVSKNIKVLGQANAESAGTAFNFTNSTHGIIRTVRGGEVNGIRVLGKKTTTVFDFEAGVFGNIGLWDKYDDTAKAGYVNTRNLHISGFDTGRVNATGGSEVWAGAYRETYDTFIKGNRCGAVFLNGATHDKYHGGTISNNSEIGIWADAQRVQYNNISFIGTTIEGNGTVDSGAGYANIDYRNNVAIFAGKNTVINLIGSYCERMMSYAKNGGVINKIGSYEHYNSLNFASDATISMIGSSVGPESKLVIIPKARTLWQVMIRGSFGVLDAPDGIVARSIINSADGYAMRSKPIHIKGNVKNKDIKRIKLSFSFKFKSGYTANTDLYMLPQMNLYSKTAGRVDVVPAAQFPLGMVKGLADGNAHSFEYYYQPRTGSTTLDESGIFDYIMLNFTFHNGSTGTYPNFSSNNLEVEIFDVDISVFTDKPKNFVYDLKSGDTASRPLLNTTDKGYRYFDTTLNKVMEWFGTVWVEGATLDNLVATATTSASLTSTSNPINTTDKYRGKLVLNTSNNKFYNALGSLPVDVWISTDGASTLTPV